MGNSLIKGAAITIQPLSQVSPIDHGSDVFRQFETCRESVNGHLNKYFGHIGHKKSHDDPPGLCARPLQSWGSEADQDTQLTQTNAIKDLIKLDDILENIKRQERPYIKAISPIIIAWYASWPSGSQVSAAGKNYPFAAQSSRTGSSVQEWDNKGFDRIIIMNITLGRRLMCSDLQPYATCDPSQPPGI
ncbi:hypothetical protein QWA68_003569 [Fusarium oxysporum]|nr:hypothetical protein QWA68_003569 [Fusarium oxysporum]